MKGRENAWSKRAQRGARTVNETSPRTLPEKAVMTMLRVLIASLWPFHVGQMGSVPCASAGCEHYGANAATREYVPWSASTSRAHRLRATHVEPLLLRVLRQVVHAALQGRGRGGDVEPDPRGARSRVGPRRQDLWDDAVIQQQVHAAFGPVRRKLLVAVSNPRA